jgi:hypothetical protein
MLTLVKLLRTSCMEYAEKSIIKTILHPLLDQWCIKDEVSQHNGVGQLWHRVGLELVYINKNL